MPLTEPGLPPDANYDKFTHEACTVAGYYNRQLVHLLRRTSVSADQPSGHGRVRPASSGPLAVVVAVFGRVRDGQSIWSVDPAPSAGLDGASGSFAQPEHGEKLDTVLGVCGVTGDDTSCPAASSFVRRHYGRLNLREPSFAVASAGPSRHVHVRSPQARWGGPRHYQHVADKRPPTNARSDTRPTRYRHSNPGDAAVRATACKPSSGDRA
jgi:hypothetical protein